MQTDNHLLKAFPIALFVLSLMPLAGQDTDFAIIQRSPYEMKDSLLFGWVPGSQHNCIPAYSGSTQFTTDYLPSGSYWDKDCNEEEVYLARMMHKEGDSVHWKLGIGRAGIIYSFIGPYGEGVPPQVHGSGDFNSAPWIDEVWQIVSVNEKLNNRERLPAPPGSTLASSVRSMFYFIHGAGAYRIDTMFARSPSPFYSPLMASWYDRQEKALYTTNWGTQAHIPSLYKSNLLYTYKYQDLGNGILESTMVISNFGDIRVSHHNMPWGGVRASSLPQQWISKPDHSLERSYNPFGGKDAGSFSSVDETGGYIIWAAEGDDPERPAMGLVFGHEKRKAELQDLGISSSMRLRFGLTNNEKRSYTVFVLIPKVHIDRGESFFTRIYYINGSLKEVHEKARRISDATDYGFIIPDPGKSSRTLIKSTDHFNALKEDILLFAEPVPGNIPLFLLENTATGVRYISPDLYHDVPTQPFENPYDPSNPKYERYQDKITYRPYDGSVNYIRLLGYGLNDPELVQGIPCKTLESLILDTNRILIPAEFKDSIWVPVK